MQPNNLKGKDKITCLLHFLDRKSLFQNAQFACEEYVDGG